MEFKFNHEAEDIHDAIGVSQDKLDKYFDMFEKIKSELYTGKKASEVLESIVNKNLTKEELQLWMSIHLFHEMYEHKKLFMIKKILTEIFDENHSCENCSHEGMAH